MNIRTIQCDVVVCEDKNCKKTYVLGRKLADFLRLERSCKEATRRIAGTWGIYVCAQMLTPFSITCVFVLTFKLSRKSKSTRPVASRLALVL